MLLAAANVRCGDSIPATPSSLFAAGANKTLPRLIGMKDGLVRWAYQALNDTLPWSHKASMVTNCMVQRQSLGRKFDCGNLAGGRLADDLHLLSGLRCVIAVTPTSQCLLRYVLSRVLKKQGRDIAKIWADMLAVSASVSGHSIAPTGLRPILLRCSVLCRSCQRLNINLATCCLLEGLKTTACV